MHSNSPNCRHVLESSENYPHIGQRHIIGLVTRLSLINTRSLRPRTSNAVETLFRSGTIVAGRTDPANGTLAVTRYKGSSFHIDVTGEIKIF